MGQAIGVCGLSSQGCIKADDKNRSSAPPVAGVQFDMDRSKEGRPAALLFLCAAATAVASQRLRSGFHLSLWDPWAELAAELSPFALLSACALVIVRPRWGYALGLLAGLLAFPWFVRTEFSDGQFNSWVFLNYESPMFGGPEPYLTAAKLKIVSVALTAMAFTYALLALVRFRWLWRGSIAAGVLVSVLWFGSSAIPYRTPAYGDGARPDLRILHIEKHGLRFHETRIGEFRDGKIFVSRYDRRLFQYRFEGITAQAERLPTALQKARALIRSPDLWNLHTPAPARLRSWNAEGWYVVLQDKHVLAFTSENGTAPPAEVTEMVHLVEDLHLREERPCVARDVCLGFCYDPMAALGLTDREREMLLNQNSSLR